MTDFTKFNASTHPIVRVEDDWNNLLDHGLEKSASYIIRKNGSYYEAVQGGGSTDAGTIAFGGSGNAGETDGTDAASVIQAALDNLTADRTWKEKVLIKDDIVVETTLNIPSYTIVEVDGRMLLGANVGMWGTSSAHDFHLIVNGELNGVRSTYTDANILVNLYDSYNFVLKLNYVVDAGGSGVVINKCHDFRIPYVAIYACEESNIRFQSTCYNGQVGLLFTSNSGQRGLQFDALTEDIYSLSFDNIITTGNTWHGIVFSGAPLCNPTHGCVFGQVISINNGQNGICMDDVYDLVFLGGLIKNNGQGAEIKDGIYMQNDPEEPSPAHDIIISRFRIFDDQESKTQDYAIQSILESDYVTVTDCDIRGNNQADHDAIKLVGVNDIITNNMGYNPVGIISDPYPEAEGDLMNASADQSYPTDGASYCVRQSPKTVIIGGGTITEIYIDGTATGLTSGVFHLNLNETIKVDWTVQPTINLVRAH